MALPELDHLFRLDTIFSELLRSPRGPRYGVTVKDAASDLSEIYVELRFLAGRSYCCAEPSCHIPSTCKQLVALAEQHALRVPDDVRVYWHCVVEEGARLQVLNSFGVSPETKAYAFDFITSGATETPGAAATPSQKPPADFSGVWTVDGVTGRSETECVGGIPNGRFRIWSREGVCLREGFKRNGKWDGQLITRGSDGVVRDVSEFSEGTGVYRIFNARGQLTDEIPMREGKAHGAAHRWSKGKLVEIRHYVDGKCAAANCGDL